MSRILTCAAVACECTASSATTLPATKQLHPHNKLLHAVAQYYFSNTERNRAYLCSCSSLLLVLTLILLITASLVVSVTCSACGAHVEYTCECGEETRSSTSAADTCSDHKLSQAAFLNIPDTVRPTEWEARPPGTGNKRATMSLHVQGM